MNYFKKLIVLASLALFASGAAAIPSLQLGPGVGPGASNDGWSYDTNTQTWVANPDGSGSVMLQATALDVHNCVDVAAYGTEGCSSEGDAFEGAGQTAYLVASLLYQGSGNKLASTDDVSGESLTISDTITATLGGTPDAGNGDWMYGTAPQNDSNSLGKHGIFKTFYKIFKFTFDEAGLVSNTVDGDDTGNNKGGWVENFAVSFNSELYVAHFDLFTMTSSTSDNCNNGDGGAPCVYAFAPYSHDAQIGVPEPSQLALFGLGLVLMLGAQIRRRRTV